MLSTGFAESRSGINGKRDKLHNRSIYVVDRSPPISNERSQLYHVFGEAGANAGAGSKERNLLKLLYRVVVQAYCITELILQADVGNSMPYSVFHHFTVLHTIYNTIGQIVARHINVASLAYFTTK